MKNALKTARLTATVVGIVLLSVACNPKEEVDNKDVKTKEKVKVMEVKTESVERTYNFTSSLLAFQEVYYAPASPGRIDKINVEVGTRFAEGDVLVEMDKTQLHQARIQLLNLANDMARFDTLIKAKSIPQQQYDQLKTQYEVAKTNVQFLEDNNKLKAPFSGIVAAKYFQNGEMYSGAPNTQVGKAAILNIVQINPLKAMVNVTEQLYPKIKNNMEVNITCDIYSDKLITGRVLRIHPTIDQISRTFQVEIQIPNSGDELRPGMFCRASFEGGQEEALLVPTLSVLKVQGANDRFVFLEKNGRAKRVEVTLGRRFDNKVEIFSKDIKEGDKLIVSGQARLVDNVEVEVVK